MRYIILILISLSGLCAVDYDAKYILVKLNTGVNKSNFKATLNSHNYVIEKTVVKRLGIYKIRILNDKLTAPIALEDMRKNPLVEKAQLDYNVSLRQTTPDDNEFHEQWSKHNTGQSGGIVDADIDALEAWDISTGGLNAANDTIVVAVVDDGMMVTHPDLAPNLWTNFHEIPDNGLDDDGNGYIDDFHGWNAVDSDGSIPINAHGTHVAGIIGARGNNGIQVSGVNWNIKLMAISSESNTSSVLEAYGYILDQRALYDSTHGGLGAFIVATNSSFGINEADCNSDDYYLWNDMYDAFGEYGILNAGATMNSNLNVDITGDVPTGCMSDYLISVTNTTHNDAKNSGAAYGEESIDLGAPGTRILSTYLGGGTTRMTGTSMASPHVAAAVGLLHSVIPIEFIRYYKNHGNNAAIIIKQLILKGTDPLPSLTGITVSGGRLNLKNSMHFAQNFIMADSLDPNNVTNLKADTSSWYQVTFSWTDPTTLFGGDAITDFIIDVKRNDLFYTRISSGIETFNDYGLLSGETVYYTFNTRLVENDSTSLSEHLSVVPSGGDCMTGDVNGDGKIDNMDVVKLILLLMEFETLGEEGICAVDIDYDGDFTINDLLRLTDILY